MLECLGLPVLEQDAHDLVELLEEQLRVLRWPVDKLELRCGRLPRCMAKRALLARAMGL